MLGFVTPSVDHIKAMRFTVSIPSWIQGVKSEGESVVMYRVNVILENSPSGPPFFVMRRYSQFRELYEQLKEKHPDIMRGDPSLLPPPKHAQLILPGLGSKETALDKRKEDLERWMWRLLAKGEIARSPLLRSFLEVERALLRLGMHAQNALNPNPGGGTPINLPGDASPFPSSSSQPDIDGMMNPHQPSLFDDSRSEASTHSGSHPANTHGTGPSPLHHLGPSTRRLGFRLESRGDVKKLVEALEQRLIRASLDMNQAASESLLLKESNKMMAQRMSELESELNSLKSKSLPTSPPPPSVPPPPPPPPPSSVTSVDHATNEGLEEMSRALSEVEGQLMASEEIRMDVSSRLAASEARAIDAETSSANATSRAEMLSQQVASLQHRLSEAYDENKQLLLRIKEWRIDESPAVSVKEEKESSPIASEREQILEGQCATLTTRCMELETELEALKVKSAKEKDKVRSDQVTLAKEIKKLRSELDEAKAALDATSPVFHQMPQPQDEINAKLQVELQASLAESALLREKLTKAEQELLEQREAIETLREGELRTVQASEVLRVSVASLTEERDRAEAKVTEIENHLKVARDHSQDLEARLASEEARVQQLLMEVHAAAHSPAPVAPSASSLAINNDEVLDLSGLTIYEPSTPLNASTVLNPPLNPQATNEEEVSASFISLFDRRVKTVLCEALNEAKAVFSALRESEKRASSVSMSIQSHGVEDEQLLDTALASFSDIGASLSLSKESARKLAIMPPIVHDNEGEEQDVRSPSPLLLLLDEEDANEARRRREAEVMSTRREKINQSLLTRAASDLRRFLSETLTDLAERETQLNDQRVEAIINAIMASSSTLSQNSSNPTHQPSTTFFQPPPSSGLPAPQVASARDGPLASLAEQLNQWRVSHSRQ